MGKMTHLSNPLDLHDVIQTEHELVFSSKHV